jgi:peptide/nickel transport system substrate-binding protein
MYDGWLDSALSSDKTATGDYERLKDPAVDQMLAKLAGAETTAQQAAALEPIAKYVAANLPVIPTTTASQWFQYNSQNYVGWPTQDNPYETGRPSEPTTVPALARTKWSSFTSARGGQAPAGAAGAFETHPGGRWLA